MNQSKREDHMFELGYNRVERQHQKAEDKGYVTTSKVIRQLTPKWIEATVKAIEAQVESIGEKPQSQNDHAFKFVTDLYSKLEPPEDFEQPQYGYELIATTLWKTIADHSFYNSSTRNLSNHIGQKIHIKTKLGQLLEQQYKVLYYSSFAEKLDIDGDENLKMLRYHIRALNELVTDKGATLDRRLGRAQGLFGELDEGTVVKRRGPKSRGVEMKLPADANFDRWDELLCERAAIQFLNLLVVPKAGPEGENDIRPFEYARSGHKTLDSVRVRDHFLNYVERIVHQMGEQVVDYIPLIEIPNDWIATDDLGQDNSTGGYHTDSVKALPTSALIRTGLGECETKPSQDACDFLNKIQSVSWTVDRSQLDIVRNIGINWPSTYDGIERPPAYTEGELRRGDGVAKLLTEVHIRDEGRKRYHQLQKAMKQHIDSTLPKYELTEEEKEFLNAFEANNTKLRELYRDAANAEQSTKVFSKVMARFEQIRTDPVLFYAWNFDSRCRTYPIGGFAQPQGDPASRFSLCFAEGELLSADGEKAALQAIGTAMIDSKVSIHKRIEEAKNNLDLIRSLADGSDRAIEVAGEYEEPLNLLSLARNWVRHEAGATWRAPVYADATNSGYQIVAALLNNQEGLQATNIRRSADDEQPNDAYRICIDQVGTWLMDCGSAPEAVQKKINGLDEIQKYKIQSVLDNTKLARKISKAYARTAVYGSGALTQSDDIQTELLDARISDVDFDPKLRMVLTNLINYAYTERLGSIGKYVRGIKKMAKERLFQGVGEETIDRYLELARERTALMGMARELPGKKLGEYLDLCRKIHSDSTHGLSYTLPDGTVIDERQYVLTKKEFKTVFHGSTVAPVTVTDALDPRNILKAVAPDVIHSLDALILRNAFTLAPYDVVTIHDAAGSHPNNFDDLCGRYRSGFLQATEGNFLQSLADQWGVELAIDMDSDTSWRDEVVDARHMFH